MLQRSLALIGFSMQILGSYCFFPQHSSHISVMICQISAPLSGAEPQEHPRRDFGGHKQFLIENSPKSS